jgi:hypothetical protein
VEAFHPKSISLPTQSSKPWKTWFNLEVWENSTLLVRLGFRFSGTASSQWQLEKRRQMFLSLSVQR